MSETGFQHEVRFYQNAGENEGGQYINRMVQMEDSLNHVGFQDVVSKVIENGDHNEATWGEDFAEAFLWLFDNDEGSTASENVMVMDENFYIPQLDRTRRIILYLPPDYNSTQKDYPVIYMHDGQNLFDEVTSAYGEWKIDETLDSLAAEGQTVPIVVGIDNSVHRADEYLPYHNPNFAGGEGDEYVAFIIETLKPYIDANYRTLSDRENTCIIGSSLGGVISWYAAVKYQEVFSKAGLFSPAYWANYDQIWGFLSETGFQNEVRFYQNAGENEGDQYIIPMIQMEDSLNHVGFQNVISKVIENGDHNEATWSNDFAEAYLWLFDKETSISLSDIESFNIYPNPVRNHLKIKLDKPNTKHVTITIIDTSGKVLITKNYYKGGINLDTLQSGLYLLKVETDQKFYTQRFIKL